jgi:Holliday junction resolvase
MRRTRAPGAGNQRELRVMDVLAEEGWLCASRRHIGGAGDVLAIQRSRGPCVNKPDAMLIEVKSTSGGPWERFGPVDRQALVETAEKHGAEAWLYWWPPRAELQRIPASDWPISRVKAQAWIEGP